MPLDPENLTNISPSEAIKLGARNAEFFYRAFFPSVFSHPSPGFAKELNTVLDSRQRFVQLVMFRGSSKTTRCRAYALRRIAYGLANTILFVGARQEDAIRSLQWIRDEIQYNQPLRQTFGLECGDKWSEGQFSVTHKLENGRTIWLAAMGITGSIRGVNFGARRPDLIIADDLLDVENTASLEQRNKTHQQVSGSLRYGLVPATENPDAKMLIVNTPQTVDDEVDRLSRDPSFLTIRCPCWTPDTVDEIVDRQESIWPERYPTATLREDKRGSIQIGNLHIFTREMEVKVTSPDLSPFRGEWLRSYEYIPENAQYVVAVDPVPPPSDREIEKGLTNKCWEAWSVVARYGEDYYLVDYALNRGHDPSWSVSVFFQFYSQYTPFAFFVEDVAYQRTLKYILDEEQKRKGVYASVILLPQRKSKYNRIVDTLKGPSVHGHLLVKPHQTEFVTDFTMFPGSGRLDLLDATSSAIEGFTRVPFSPYEKGPRFSKSLGSALPKYVGLPCP